MEKNDRKWSEKNSFKMNEKGKTKQKNAIYILKQVVQIKFLP